MTPPPLALDRRTVLATGAAGAALAGTTLASPSPAGAGPRRRVPPRHRLRRPHPRLRPALDPGHPHPGEHSRLGSRPTGRPSTWEVARDAGFRDVVRRGPVETAPWRDHTVKVDVDGLAPARWYFYRFRCAGVTSRTGRTRTAPAADALPRNLRLGVVSCANWQAGWFSAYRGLAARDDLHAVLHLGDYLYEYGGPGSYGDGPDNEHVRDHVPAREMVALADYRQRHAQYKTDPDLQDAHAKFPWIITWDDHEVTNDSWRRGAENHQPDEGDYLRRRARAHRAYDEWMPVRMDGTAKLGDGARLFRRLKFGQLAEISMLDLRTYRSKQVEQPAFPAPHPDPAISDPDRTITGDRQLEWLKDSLDNDRAQWKVIGNPVMIAPVNFASLPDDVVGPINDVTGLLPEDGAALQRRPVGRLHRRPAPDLQPHPRPRGARTRCSSPATSTPGGPASCPTTPRPTRWATRPAWSSCAAR